MHTLRSILTSFPELRLIKTRVMALWTVAFEEAESRNRKPCKALIGFGRVNKTLKHGYKQSRMSQRVIAFYSMHAKQQDGRETGYKRANKQECVYFSFSPSRCRSPSVCLPSLPFLDRRCLQGVVTPVDVQVAVSEGGALGLGDLLVVEDDPLSALLDVAHVVPTGRTGTHV